MILDLGMPLQKKKKKKKKVNVNHCVLFDRVWRFVISRLFLPSQQGTLPSRDPLDSGVSE